jgi:L-fuconolactonase
MAERIDAHHHLWSYSAEEYGWIDDGMSLLQRDFLVADLENALQSGTMDGAVAVQAHQSIQEASWLLALAEQSSYMRGVVGWAPIASEAFEAELELLLSHRKLKGLRHVIQGEPDDDFILGSDFNRGIARMLSTGLVYDILIFEKHLPQTIQFVDRHPQQVFVLDHIAKPRIREGLIEPWRKNISALAERENLYCKVSGMVTEADWSNWKQADLQPYWDAVLAAFGPRRLMFGSDWPVCLVASSYAKWCETVENWTRQMSQDERELIFGGTATEVYRL